MPLYVVIKNGFTWNHQVLHGHPDQPRLQAHQKCLHYLLPIRCYHKKAIGNAMSDDWVEFLDKSFSLDHEILLSYQGDSLLDMTSLAASSRLQIGYEHYKHKNHASGPYSRINSAII